MGEEYLDQSIAPLTIQILVENAIKHNRISRNHPLNVKVYVDGNNSIVVKNNLQRKNVIEKSTKTGLANIRKRYAYFGQEQHRSGVLRPGFSGSGALATDKL